MQSGRYTSYLAALAGLGNARLRSRAYASNFEQRAAHRELNFNFRRIALDRNALLLEHPTEYVELVFCIGLAFLNGVNGPPAVELLERLELTDEESLFGVKNAGPKHLTDALRLQIKNLASSDPRRGTEV